MAEFVGRTAELADIDTALQDSRSIWISGMPGAGKSQLALTAAQHARQLGRPAVLVDLRGHRSGSAPVAAAAAQRAILRLLGTDEGFSSDDDARAEQIAQLLRESGSVLVLDDAADFEQVRRVVGRAPASPVIVTSRALSGGDDEHWLHVPLHGLAPTETAQLLTRLGHADSSPVTDAEARRLTAACDGLPLALALVGSRLSTHRGWSLADHIDLMERRIGEGRLDDAVRTELDLSYGELTADAARLLRACADIPVGELSPMAMAVLTDSAAHETAEAAEELFERSLAVRGAGGGLTLHSLVRAYALDRAEETDPPVIRRMAFSRLARHIAEHVWGAYDIVIREQGDVPRPTAFAYPVPDWTVDEASDWLRNSLAAALAIAHEAPQRGRPDMLFRISEGLSWWMNVTGHQVAALKLHEAAADLASELDDADALAMASLDAGQLLVHRDRPEEALAHFARARSLISSERSMADPGVLGVLANMEAIVRLRLGEADEAIAALRDAAELHERLGEHTRLAGALTNLGVALHTAGRYDEEREVLERGLALTEHGNVLHRAYFLVNRSELHVELGELDDAVADANQAIGLAADIGTPFLEVSARTALAEVARQRGDLLAAQREITAALATARALGAEVVMTQVLLQSARIAATAGDRAHALEALTEVDSLLVDDGDHLSRGQAMQLRSELSDDSGQRHVWRERAIDAYLRAGAEHRADALRS